MLNFFRASIFLRSANRKSHWGPDLDNTVDGEAICSLIHAILPSFSRSVHSADCRLESGVL
jgi:hypothetical protein